MLVLLCKAIKLLVVYTEAQASVRLSYKEHRRGEGRVARHNEPLMQVL